METEFIQKGNCSFLMYYLIVAGRNPRYNCVWGTSASRYGARRLRQGASPGLGWARSAPAVALNGDAQPGPE